MAIANAAQTGKFSSDRTIREYCSEIWRVAPVPIPSVVETTDRFDRAPEPPVVGRAAPH